MPLSMPRVPVLISWAAISLSQVFKPTEATFDVKDAGPQDASSGPGHWNESLGLYNPNCGMSGAMFHSRDMKFCVKKSCTVRGV